MTGRFGRMSIYARALAASIGGATMVSTERLRFERILCPLDLSPNSNEALRYAIALTRAFGAQLLVCHCLGSTTASARDHEELAGRLDATVREYSRLPAR